MSAQANGIISCRQVDEYLDAEFSGAEPALPEEVRDHIRTCKRCADLHRWIAGEPDAVDTGSDRLAASIADQLGQNLEPVKPLPSNRVLVLRFLAIFSALGVAFTMWTGLGGFEQMSLPQLLLVSLILGIGAVLLAVSLSWQMAPGQERRMPVKFLVGGFAAGFLIVVAAMFPWAPEGVFRAGWGCTKVGLLMAVPVGGVLLCLAMRGAPLSYPALGASLGAASGLLAVTVLQISCHMQEASHILLWHGSVLIVSIGVGYLVGCLAEYVSLRARG